MKKILINNVGLLKDLDALAQQVLRHPMTYTYLPKPNISMAKLKEKMDANDGIMDESNTIDYAGRIFQTHEYLHQPAIPGVSKAFNQPTPCTLRNHIVDYIRRRTDNKQWEMDTWEVQPDKWGWTPWHNGKDKPINFVRFVWNSGTGFTRYISHDKKAYKYQDSKYSGQKNWNCLVGKLDGRQWLADRNTGIHKRVVIQFVLPSKYTKSHDEFINMIQNGNKTETYDMWDSQRANAS